MNKRPGHVDVTTEVGYCNFCGRTRNLRSEAHRLGELVRTIVTCETCHRTISNSIGVAPAEPEPEPAAEPAAAPAKEVAPVAEARTEEKPKPRRAPARRATKAAAARPKTPPKPRSTATRRTTKKKP